MVLVFTLQGCGIRKAETSRKVTLSEDEKFLVVTLKSNTEDHFEWRYLGPVIISESKLANDIFSNTYIQKYKFSINSGVNEAVVDFVLIQNGDIDNAMAYEYVVTRNDDKISLGDCKEKTVGYYDDLKTALQ